MLVAAKAGLMDNVFYGHGGFLKQPGATEGRLLPLDDWLPAEFIADKILQN